MKKNLNLLLLVLLIIAFIFTRLYKIDQSLLFFNDIGRDFLVLFRWQESGKPPLLGPQTSALPYNQSAVYFYLLFPAYLLTGHSPFATIFTAVIFYVFALIFGFYYLKDSQKLQSAYLFVYALILIAPQYIIQNRFVWNPSFVGPLIVLAFFAFHKLSKQDVWSKKDLLIFVLCITLAVSLSYSIAPLFLSFMIWSIYIFRKKFRFLKLFFI